MNLCYLFFKFKLIISVLLTEMTYFNSYLLISLITVVISLIKLFNWVLVENWNFLNWLFLSGEELIIIYLNWFKNVNWFLNSSFHFKIVYLDLIFKFTFFVPIVLFKGKNNDWFRIFYSNYLTAIWKSGL